MECQISDYQRLFKKPLYAFIYFVSGFLKEILFLIFDIFFLSFLSQIGIVLYETKLESQIIVGGMRSK